MDEGVAPSRLGAQPVGEVARIVEGVHQVKLPVPFPLPFVSVYLVEDGWTLGVLVLSQQDDDPDH